MRAAALGFVVAVGFGLFAACSDSDGAQAPVHAGGSSNSSDGGSDCEGRGESFSAGMTKQTADGSITVELVSSDVAPPGEGINAWTLRFRDAGGQAIAGAALRASFKMPDHTHKPQQKDGRETEAGTYEVEPYFSMPGLWEITVTVTPSGGSAANVVFYFCVAPD
jgi:hypothetical protein